MNYEQIEIKGIDIIKIQEMINNFFTNCTVLRYGNVVKIKFKKPNWIKRHLRASKEYHRYKIDYFLDYIKSNAESANGSFTCYHPFNGKKVGEFSIDMKKNDISHFLKRASPEVQHKQLKLYNIRASSPYDKGLRTDEYLLLGTEAIEDLNDISKNIFNIDINHPYSNYMFERKIKNGFLFIISHSIKD